MVALGTTQVSIYFYLKDYEIAGLKVCQYLPFIFS